MNFRTSAFFMLTVLVSLSLTSCGSGGSSATGEGSTGTTSSIRGIDAPTWERHCWTLSDIVHFCFIPFFRLQIPSVVYPTEQNGLELSTAMPRTLVRLANQNFVGFGCSDCGWRFQPRGDVVGKSFEEMKRNFEVQRDKEFAAHECAKYPKSTRRKTE